MFRMLSRVLGCLVLLGLVSYGQTPYGKVPHLQKIGEGVYRGNQPHDDDYAKLAEMGVRTVIDLRGGIFHGPKEKKKVEAAGMRYVCVRLSGLLAPRDHQIAKIVSVLEDPEQKPVFVHCKRGGDRVGLVMACYRMMHDNWTNEQAMDEACALGLTKWEILMRRYIRKFDAKKVREQCEVKGTK